MMISPTCFRTAAVDVFGQMNATDFKSDQFSKFLLCLLHLNCHLDTANIVLSTALPYRIQSPLRIATITTTATTRLTHQAARSTASASPDRAFQERVQEISQVSSDPYPRLVTDARTVSCGEFRTRYAHLGNNESVEEPVVVSGRSPQLLGPLRPSSVLYT